MDDWYCFNVLRIDCLIKEGINLSEENFFLCKSLKEDVEEMAWLLVACGCSKGKPCWEWQWWSCMWMAMASIKKKN